MTGIQTSIGTRTQLNTTSFATLANATYVNPGTITRTDVNTNDIYLELNVTPNGTVTGNKRIVLKAQISIDGTNFSSGPTSGTTTTDDGDLYLIGTVPTATNSGAQSGVFSVLASLGFIPKAIKPVVFNDCGVSLSAGTLYYAEVTNPIA